MSSVLKATLLYTTQQKAHAGVLLASVFCERYSRVYHIQAPKQITVTLNSQEPQLESLVKQALNVKAWTVFVIHEVRE
jgi:hypothetical protein